MWLQTPWTKDDHSDRIRVMCFSITILEGGPYMKVIKRDGSVSECDIAKISAAIAKAQRIHPQDLDSLSRHALQ